MKDTSWEMWLKLASSPVGSPALRKRQGYLNLGKRKEKKKEGKGRNGEMKREKKKGKKFWIDGIICLRMAGSKNMVELSKKPGGMCL